MRRPQQHIRRVWKRYGSAIIRRPVLVNRGIKYHPKRRYGSIITPVVEGVALASMLRQNFGSVGNNLPPKYRQQFEQAKPIQTTEEERKHIRSVSEAEVRSIENREAVRKANQQILEKIRDLEAKKSEEAEIDKKRQLLQRSQELENSMRKHEDSFDDISKLQKEIDLVKARTRSVMRDEKERDLRKQLDEAKAVESQQRMALAKKYSMWKSDFVVAFPDLPFPKLDFHF